MKEMDNVALPEQADKYVHWYSTEQLFCKMLTLTCKKKKKKMQAVFYTGVMPPTGQQGGW